MLSVLTLTTLFPNSVQTRHGIFVEARLRRLRDTRAIAPSVVAPVPWFPFKAAMFGRYAPFACVPRREERGGLTVHHPRYLVIPKVGMNLAPRLMCAGIGTVVARLHRAERFALIDAHFLYPDGVAAVQLGERLGIPVVLTARGSDVNLYTRYRRPRRMILRAIDRARAVIAVSGALKDALVACGARQDRIHVLRNGVDLAAFAPIDRARSKSQLGIDGPMLLSVGHLEEHKGHELVIAALARLPAVTLVIIGEGPLRRQLLRLAADLGVSDRVRIIDNVEQTLLPLYYSAADALALCSTREGMPNVVLESLACGTPVIAAAVGGVAEVVTSPQAGALLGERSAAAVAAAFAMLAERRIEPAAVRSHAAQFDWSATIAAQLELYRRVAGG